MFTAIYQDSSLKRKQLDKLYYQNKQKMKKFFDLKVQVEMGYSFENSKSIAPWNRPAFSL